jgi:hypothetical protein
MPPGVLMMSGRSGSRGAVLGLWKELVGEWWYIALELRLAGGAGAGTGTLGI